MAQGLLVPDSMSAEGCCRPESQERGQAGDVPMMHYQHKGKAVGEYVQGTRTELGLP